MLMLTKKPSKNPPAKPWKGVTGVNVAYHRARLQACAIALRAVTSELLRRRVGLSPARPPKVKNVPAAPIVCPTITPEILALAAQARAALTPAV